MQSTHLQIMAAGELISEADWFTRKLPNNQQIKEYFVQKYRPTRQIFRSSLDGHCHTTDVVCTFSSFFLSRVRQPTMLRTVLFRPAILQPRFHQRTVTTSAPNFTFFNELYADLSKSSLVANTQHLIESVHDYTHLPWWASIVITTVSLRLAITLPLAAYQVFSFIVILKTLSLTLFLSTRSMPNWKTWNQKWTASSKTSRKRLTVQSLCIGGMPRQPR